MGKRAKKGPETLWDKVKKFDSDLAVGINGMTEDELKGRLVSIAEGDRKLEDAKEVDVDLISARENLKTCNETYSRPLKENKLRRRLILETLEGRGKL